MRVYYSSYHLWAAKHFTRLSSTIEDQHTGRSVFDSAHRAYVTNAILSSVSFLEAAINELFQDAADEHYSYISDLGKANMALLAGLWQSREGQSIPRWSTLDKYQLVLLLTGKPLFEKGAPPYQEATLLVRLRNALVHFRPETLGLDSPHKLTSALCTKFPTNRLMKGSANPYFPDHCLGTGCAGWAVGAAENLADEFFSRLEIEPNYQRVDFGPP